jgi:hypothetical protein
MAEVDPDQEAALRRLRPAFGLVVIVQVVDHEAGPAMTRWPRTEIRCRHQVGSIRRQPRPMGV